jgi:dTDP-glucose 4,6-dehydratase
MDFERARVELEWSPSVTFEEGLRDTVRWYLQYETWWRRVMSGEYWTYHQKQYGSQPSS